MTPGIPAFPAVIPDGFGNARTGPSGAGHLVVVSDIINGWTTPDCPGPRGVADTASPAPSAPRSSPCRSGLRSVRLRADRPDETVLFVGDDEHGHPVEVVGVELADGGLRVIHAMSMRDSYRGLYEEAIRWQQ